MIKAEPVGVRSGCFVVWIALKRQNKTMVKDRLSELKSVSVVLRESVADFPFILSGLAGRDRR